MRKKALLYLTCLSASSGWAMPGQIIIVSQAETSDPYTLSPIGQERAGALGYELSSFDIETDEFGPPVAIFSARGSLPSLQTATPLSGVLNIPIHVGFSALHPQDIVNFIFNNPEYDEKNVTIFWDPAGIPSLIGAFGFLPITPSSVRPYINYVLEPPAANPTTKVTRELQLLLYSDPAHLPPY